MPNSIAENELVRSAVTAITSRYGQWISMNPTTTQFLADVSGPQIAVWVRFLDSEAFMNNLGQGTASRIGSNCTVCGFCAPVLGKPFSKEMYINRAAGTPGTVVHEMLHFLTHPAFTMYIPSVTQEAVTEYFTRKVLSKSGDDTFTKVDRSNTYAMAHTFLGMGRQEMKKDPAYQKSYMKKAYFQGDISAIGFVKSGLQDLATMLS